MNSLDIFTFITPTHCPQNGRKQRFGLTISHAFFCFCLYLYLSLVLVLRLSFSLFSMIFWVGSLPPTPDSGELQYVHSTILKHMMTRKGWVGLVTCERGPVMVQLDRYLPSWRYIQATSTTDTSLFRSIGWGVGGNYGCIFILGCWALVSYQMSCMLCRRGMGDLKGRWS